jgi:hypothetical protein
MNVGYKEKVGTVNTFHGRGFFEHAKLTATHMASEKKLICAVCKSNYQN